MGRRVLTEDEVCFGFPCKAGTEVDDFERSGTLAESVTYRGIDLPRLSRFGRDCDFDFLWVSLAVDTEVHGHRIPADSLLELAPVPPPLSVVYSIVGLPFYPLALGRSLYELVQQRVTVVPSGDVVIEGHSICAGERFELTKSGRVASWTLKSPRVVQGLDLQSGWLRFNQGRVREIMLYRSQPLLGFPCFGSGLRGTEIRLRADGTPERLVLGDDHVVEGVRYSRGTRLRLSEDGRVLSANRMDIDVALFQLRP